MKHATRILVLCFVFFFFLVALAEATNIRTLERDTKREFVTKFAESNSSFSFVSANCNGVSDHSNYTHYHHYFCTVILRNSSGFLLDRRYYNVKISHSGAITWTKSN